MNEKLKPALKFGLIGAAIAWLVTLGVRLATGTDLGEISAFGPVAAGEIFIAVIGIVGAIIGAYRKQ